MYTFLHIYACRVKNSLRHAITPATDRRPRPPIDGLIACVRCPDSSPLGPIADRNRWVGSLWLSSSCLRRGKEARTEGTVHKHSILCTMGRRLSQLHEARNIGAI